tara:strand:+ start:63 stop:788 length:726 start_codon:yes stop_codon:yes gene_type:complete
MVRFGAVPTGRLYDVKSISIHSDGQPILFSLFTFNKERRRFEKWGHRELESAENLTVGNGYGEPVQLPSVGDGVREWYEPAGFRVLWSGTKGDDLLIGENPLGGHVGLRARPAFIEGFWNPNNDDEIYIGVQTDLSFTGSPYDVAARMGWRHNFQQGQGLRLAAGIGTYLQGSTDDQGGGGAQPGNFADSLGPHHFKPYIDAFASWDLGGPSDSGLSFDVSVELDLVTGHTTGTVGLGFGF